MCICLLLYNSTVSTYVTYGNYCVYVDVGSHCSSTSRGLIKIHTRHIVASRCVFGTGHATCGTLALHDETNPTSSRPNINTSSLEKNYVLYNFWRHKIPTGLRRLFVVIGTYLCAPTSQKKDFHTLFRVDLIGIPSTLLRYVLLRSQGCLYDNCTCIT